MLCAETDNSETETDNSVIPLQLLQLEKTPFLGIVMIIPLVQSSGIFFCSHISAMCGSRISAAKLGSALNNWSLRLSQPGAFTFFNAFIAEMTSCLICRLVLISNSAIAL